MGNAYPTSGNRKQYSGSSSVHDDDDADLDSDTGAALVSLLAENARLRALVVQLSDLVLRNVVNAEVTRSSIRYSSASDFNEIDSHTATTIMIAVVRIDSISGDSPLANQASTPSAMMPTPCES